MQIFVTAIQYPVQFGLALLVAAVFVTTLVPAAMSPERETGSIGWIRAITGPNAKILCGILFLDWVAASGLLNRPSRTRRTRPAARSRSPRCSRASSS